MHFPIYDPLGDLGHVNSKSANGPKWRVCVIKGVNGEVYTIYKLEQFKQKQNF